MAAYVKYNNIIRVHIRSQNEACEELCTARACLIVAKYYRACKCVVFTMMSLATDLKNPDATLSISFSPLGLVRHGQIFKPPRYGSQQDEISH